MKSKHHWSTALEALDACKDAVAWARAQPSLAAAWKNCERADWMLWLLGRERTQAAPQELVLIASECARAVLHLVPAGDDRPRLAIEAAERWAANPSAANAAASRDASAAAWAAGDAARAAAHAAASAAAWAAGDAAWAAARDAEWAASAAAMAAANAAAARDARDAARDAEWAASAAALKDYCHIVRRHFPEPPKL